MTALDRRVGELMVRLRLTRRAATRQALAEAYGPAGPPKHMPLPDRPDRRSDYHLTA